MMNSISVEGCVRPTRTGAKELEYFFIIATERERERVFKLKITKTKVLSYSRQKKELCGFGILGNKKKRVQHLGLVVETERSWEGENGTQVVERN